MDRRRRAWFWVMLQLLAACLPVSVRLFAQIPAAAAFAEAGYIFEVEAVLETPIPTDEPAPAETPPPASEAAVSSDIGFHVEVIRATEPPAWVGKRVLIYHSHTWEAYQQVADAPYQETEKWRTKDDHCNMVAVGTALTAHLRALGVTVVHDTTAFEPPNLDDAYSRSLAMLERRHDSGEAYDLYIDLHRDALSAQSTIRRTVMIGGEESARFMVLIGKGTTGGYAEKPDWERNLVIAERITASLNAQAEGLARDVKIKTGRFNQHVAPCCVLIECGVNTNTLQQVMTGLPYLAQAIAEALAAQ